MNERELAEIEARAAAATPGDWMDVRPLDHEGCDVWPWEEVEDMEFAYHARTDIPKLCAEVRRLGAATDEDYERTEWIAEGKGWRVFDDRCPHCCVKGHKAAEYGHNVHCPLRRDGEPTWEHTDSVVEPS